MLRYTLASQWILMLASMLMALVHLVEGEVAIAAQSNFCTVSLWSHFLHLCNWNIFSTEVCNLQHPLYWLKLAYRFDYYCSINMCAETAYCSWLRQSLYNLLTILHVCFYPSNTILHTFTFYMFIYFLTIQPLNPRESHICSNETSSVVLKGPISYLFPEF